MQKQESNNSRKITKVSLVIYSSIMIALVIICLTLSFCLKNMSILWGYLLCLGPSFIFVFLSVILSTELMLKPDSSKGIIAWHVIIYVFKYLLIIGIPLIGVWKPTIFNRWSMLATTLISPILVIIVKLIFANYVSKNNKKK